MILLTKELRDDVTSAGERPVNARDNDLLTRVGPGTAMGSLLRRYWIPALASSQLPQPDGAPVRVTLLGEKLLAVRGTDGEVALFQEHCPHRRASLFFGRNEQHGLRCAYHGWKFSFDGYCVETPGEPNGNFKSKVHITTYPCIEQCDVIWAYMGPAELRPEAPRLEWSLVPASHRFITKRTQETNWFQALEGGYDYSHIEMLHRDYVTTNAAGQYNVGLFHLETLETYYGLLFGRSQDTPSGRARWILSQFLMPFHKILPTFVDGGTCSAHAWVPIDDEHCSLWTIDYHADRPLEEAELAEARQWMGIHSEVVENTDLPVLNKENNYGLDRALQSSGASFTGIRGVGVQDGAIQESQGAIFDRTKEHLCSSDKHIIALRRYFLKMVSHPEVPGLPPGLNCPAPPLKTNIVVSDRGVPLDEIAVDVARASKVV